MDTRGSFYLISFVLLGGKKICQVRL